MGANFYGELVVRITSDTSGLTTGLQRSAAQTKAAGASMAQNMNRVGMGLQNIGRTMTQFVTLPVAAGFAVAGIAAFKFEDQLIKIKNLTGLTAEETKKYGDAILKMGGETGQTPIQLAEAFYFLASSGFKGKEAIDALKVSAQASAAGLGDVMATADVVSSAVNAYGHANLTAAHMVDVLMKTIEVGKAEPEQLAASLGRIMPVAQGLAVPIEDLGGMIAGLTLTGLSSAEAVTSLRGTMMALTAPTKMSIEAYKEMGLTYEQVTKSIKDRGLLPTLQTLYEMVDGDRLAMRKLIPNVRALNGVLSLLGPNYEKNLEVIDKVNNAQGKLNKTFADTKETNVFKLRAAWAKLQAEFIKIGSIILPYVAEFAEWLGRLVESFNELEEGTKKWIMQLLLVAAALGPLAMIFGSVFRAAALIGPVVVGAFKAIGAAIFAVKAVAVGAATAGEGLALMAAAIGPVGVGLLAIAAAAGAIYGIVKLSNWLDGTTERMEKMKRAADLLDADTSGKLKAWTQKMFGSSLVIKDGKVVWQPAVEVVTPPQGSSSLVKWIKREAQEARNATREANKMQRIEVARGAVAAAQQAAKIYGEKAAFAHGPRQRDRYLGLQAQAQADARSWGIQLAQLTGQMQSLQEAGANLAVFAGMKDQQNAVAKQIQKVKELKAELAKKPGSVSLGLKVDSAERRLANLRNNLDAYLKQNHEIILKVRSEQLQDRLKAVQTALRNLDREEPSPEVKLLSAEYQKEAIRIMRELGIIDAQLAMPTVGLNDQASGKISAINQALANMPTEKYIRVMVTGGGVIPRDAYGGYYTKPRLTLVGEDGPEVILPLTKPGRMAKLMQQSGLSRMLAATPTQARGHAASRQYAASAGGEVHHHYHSTVSLPGGTIVDQPQKLADRLAPYQAANMKTATRRRMRGQVA